MLSLSFVSFVLLYFCISFDLLSPAFVSFSRLSIRFVPFCLLYLRSAISILCLVHYVIHLMLSVSCYPSHVIRLMLSVSCYPSHVIRLMLSVSCYPSHVTVSCYPSHVGHPISCSRLQASYSSHNFYLCTQSIFSPSIYTFIICKQPVPPGIISFPRQLSFLQPRNVCLRANIARV